jgi:hypothetical protein
VNRLVIFGNIELTEVNIGFKTAGRQVERTVDERDTVRKGQVIARLGRDQTRIWSNPDLRSRITSYPGVAANILLLIMLMLTACRPASMVLSQQFFQGHRCSGEVDVHRRVLALEVNGLEHRNNIPITAGGLCQRHDRPEFFLKLPGGI